MQWNNESGLAAADRMTKYGANAVKRHGDWFWDCLTGWEIETETTVFSINKIANELSTHFGLAKRTATLYTYAFFAYAKHAPDEFSGPTSKITRIGNGNYIMTDNPER